MDWKMLSTDDGNRIRGSYGDAVVVDPAELIDLAEYLESITSVVYWEASLSVGRETTFPNVCGRLSPNPDPVERRKSWIYSHALSAATLI